MSTKSCSSASVHSRVYTPYVPQKTEDFRRALIKIDFAFFAAFGNLPALTIDQRDFSRYFSAPSPYSGPTFSTPRTNVKFTPKEYEICDFADAEESSEGEGKHASDSDDDVLPELTPLTLERSTPRPPQVLVPRTSSARLPLSERVYFDRSTFQSPVHTPLRHFDFSSNQLNDAPATPVLAPTPPTRGFLPGKMLLPPPIVVPPPAPEKRRIYVAARNSEAQSLRRVNPPTPTTPRPENAFRTAFNSPEQSTEKRAKKE